jgi:hypothetical protein
MCLLTPEKNVTFNEYKTDTPEQVGSTAPFLSYSSVLIESCNTLTSQIENLKGRINQQR